MFLSHSIGYVHGSLYIIMRREESYFSLRCFDSILFQHGDALKDLWLLLGYILLYIVAFKLPMAPFKLLVLLEGCAKTGCWIFG
jgi:hypothetical protein